MASPDPDRSTTARLRTAQILVGALIAGVTVFLAIAAGLRPSQGQRPAQQPLVSLIGLAFAGAALAAYFVVPNLVLASWRRQVARGVWPAQDNAPRQAGTAPEGVSQDTGSRWWGLYQTHLILRAALLEGAAFFQPVAYLLEGQTFSLAVALGFLAGMCALFPTRSRGKPGG